MILLNSKPFLNSYNDDEEIEHNKETLDILSQFYLKNDYSCKLVITRMSDDAINEEPLILDCKLSEALQLCKDTVDTTNGINVYSDDCDIVLECISKITNDNGCVHTPVYEARIIPYTEKGIYIKLFND